MGAFFSQRLGPYTILQELEQGGMASIDLALRDDDDKLCVIKRLHDGDWSNGSNLKRFHREAKLASLLDHPNIARVLDAGIEDDVFCIVSEYVPGKTLASYRASVSRKARRIPVPLTTHIAVEVLNALDHVHSTRDETGEPLNLVHRDISARNVMISFGGEVKVIDFGLAKANLGDFKTQQGTLLGTFPYQSPEQATGAPVDLRSDLYSLSVILFETLSGRMLIARTQPAEMLRKILDLKIPPHSAFPADVPVGVRSAVLRGLAKNPRDRWASAADYRDAILLGSSLPADPITPELARAVREEFPKDAREMARIILFYKGGGDGLVTSLSSEGIDIPEGEEEPPTVAKVEAVPAPTALIEEAQPIGSSAAPITEPEVQVWAARKLQWVVGLMIFVCGWAVGWLLLPYLT